MQPRTHSTLFTALGLLLVVGALLAVIQPAPPVVQAQTTESFVQEVIDRTNAIRVAHGLAPLKLQINLHTAAQWISEDSANRNLISHLDSLDRTVSQRVPAFGYTSYSAIGENLAMGHTSPAAVLDGWMASGTHSKNILDPTFCEIGVGYVEDPADPQRYYWAQNFGCRPDLTLLLINSDAPTTDNALVNLYIHGADWAQELRFSNDGANWSEWEGTHAQHNNWQVMAGSGTRIVYVELRRDGVVRQASDQIQLIDTTTPIEYNYAVYVPFVQR